MKILFLHPNFPAQFKNSCQHFAEAGHEVKFICQTHYGRTLKNVTRIAIKYKGGIEEFNENANTELKKMNVRSSDYRNAFIQLKNSNWNPDLIISHSGWGCGVHVKEIWPRSKFIAYVEWWFNPTSTLINTIKNNEYLKYSDQSMQSLWARNVPMTFEISLADIAIAPTEWQKEQIPELLKKNCEVIFDGVNKSLFKCNRKEMSIRPKITYGTRGMEPIRCFPEFIKTLPNLLQKWPDLTVEIAGVDKICYGGKKPKEGSWGKWAKKYLEGEKVSHRVTWMGYLELKDYIKWLQSSWCHVYLSQPYVTSWSLLESIFCKTPIVVNDNRAIKEFTARIPYVIHSKDLNPKSLNEAISAQLRNRKNRTDNFDTDELNRQLTIWSTEATMRAWETVSKTLVEQ